MNRRRMRSHRRKQLPKALLGLGALALFAVVFYWFFQALDYHLSQPEETIPPTYGNEESYVYLNGTAYTEKEQLTTLLLLGIDHEGKVEPVEGGVNGRQCDVVTLVVLDQETNQMTLLQLNRDTMTTIQRLSIDGKPAYELYAQLATAHAYGSGMEDSCRNAVDAVENLLYGQEIDHYLSLNMTGLEVLVDSVGGVTATIEEDFTHIDPQMTQGTTMLLNGKQAIAYLRGRQSVGDGSNLGRMERQRLFLEQVLGQLSEKQEQALDNIGVEAADYLVTDMSVNRLDQTLERLAEAEFCGIVTPEGEAVVGEEFMEFYVEEDSLRELVIQLFYEPVEEPHD